MEYHFHIKELFENVTRWPSWLGTPSIPMLEVLPLTSNTFSNFGRVQNWSFCYITFDPIKHSYHYTWPLEIQNTHCCFMQLVIVGMKQLKFPHKVFVKCSNPTEATNLEDSDRHQQINNGFHLARLHFVKRQCTLRRAGRKVLVKVPF